MKVLEQRALRGPNRYHMKPMILMRVDIGALEDAPTDTLDGFTDRLLARVPTLHEHHCSIGRPGGFTERLRRGTWAAHVVEHVALELQALAGMDVRHGKTRSTRDRGVYNVAYRYENEAAGLRAGRDAVDLVDALIAGRAVDVDAIVARLRDLRDRTHPGPSTGSILAEAARRGIPVIPLEDADLVQLGHGARQQRIQATLTSRTPVLGVEIADEKDRTKRVLEAIGVPVPEGRVARTVDEARDAARAVGYPVVVKPRVGNHGRGITIGVDSEDALVDAFERARREDARVVIERTLRGADHRLLVIDHRLVAAARRDPAQVTGDGASTVRELVDAANADPRRGNGHQNVLTRIRVDAHARGVLAKQGLTLESVPERGERVLLAETANLSTGGTATDVTDTVHPAVRALAERVSRHLDLDVCGLDVVADDLTRPLHETGGGVVEVNAAPGFRMHLAPAHGTPRNVAAPLVDMLFPDGSDGRIPIVAVTGTNGKTTTVTLIRHILQAHGARVGSATTNGVSVDGELFLTGDWSGPGGAQAVLREPDVDHAVLEVARGGILRRGLGFDRCDVGVFLNVARDHLGEEDVETVDDLAHVKGVVVEAVTDGGTAVLNAEDPRVLRYAKRTRGRVVLFALDATHDAFRAHVDAGGRGLTVEDGMLIVHDGGSTRALVNVDEIPLTFGGRARFNVQNVLASVAVALALDVPERTVVRALKAFEPGPDTLPGRLTRVDAHGIRVLLDYGHNVAALRALADVLPGLANGGRRLNVASATGNREDADLRAFGEALVGLYDHVIVCDPDPRGRPVGETAGHVMDGLKDAGFPEDRVTYVEEELAAIDVALEMARPGDLVVLQVADVTDALARVRAWAGAAPGEAGMDAAAEDAEGATGAASASAWGH